MFELRAIACLRDDGAREWSQVMRTRTRKLGFEARFGDTRHAARLAV